jgi:GNAT superfamily N-acetyltransferase
MKNPSDPSALFLAEVATRFPDIRLREETDNDLAFLTTLFITGSPLAGTLPPFMLQQQADFQNQGHRADFPTASRWIILRGDTLIGRMIIDWDVDDMTNCVDLALMPVAQGQGLGLGLLQAWTAAADKLNKPSCLSVLADHRARAAYERLGFVPSGDPSQPSITMIRPAGG